MKVDVLTGFLPFGSATKSANILQPLELELKKPTRPRVFEVN